METNLPSTLAAVILFGGTSSRLGQDKARLTYQGTPLLRRIYDLAQEIADPVYGVTPWCDRYRSILPDNVIWIREPLPTQGPLGGFALALPQIASEWVLLLPCDLPRLTADWLANGKAQLAAVDPFAIAFLPRQTQGWEPLCGFYRQHCLPELQAYLKKGGRSFQGWLAEQTVAEWAIDNSQALFNCNTPQDWQVLTASEDATELLSKRE